MIALRTICGSTGKRRFRILEGRQIPKHLMGFLDITRLKAEEVIGDEKKDKETTGRKSKEPFVND
ncbi:hypothetical protein LCGC14_1669370 [marine sediment metagenome]|uniref:Uncharacterized protein n=1 Tax=marine sediment metagenome TaxID=412755 RepID=A0A0F9IEF5_9ZZZZ